MLELLPELARKTLSSRRDWPEWWNWELELSGHLLRRMVDRGFTETDLRGMLQDANRLEPDVEPGRWVIGAKWLGNGWEVVVEPDRESRRLVVITAYMVG